MRTKPREPGHGRLSDVLVWGTFIAPGIILNKDGSLQTTYRFRGPDLDSTTTSGLVATMARINNALRRLGSGWALHMEARRRVSDEYPDLVRTPSAAWLIDCERRQTFAESGTKLVTDFHVTFTYLLPEIDRRRRQAGCSRTSRPKPTVRSTIRSRRSSTWSIRSSTCSAPSCR